MCVLLLRRVASSIEFTFFTSTAHGLRASDTMIVILLTAATMDVRARIDSTGGVTCRSLRPGRQIKNLGGQEYNAYR